VAAEYRGLGFDPVPGSPDAVAAAADRCRRASAHLDTATRDLDGIPGWQGGAADAFLARIDAAPTELAAVQGGLGAAADILDEWADILVADRREADDLDRRAQDLRRMIDQAEDSVAAATRAMQVALGSATRTAQAEHAVAIARRSQLGDQLDALLEQARALEDDHNDAARRIADRLWALADDDRAEGTLMTDDLFGGLAAALGGFSAQAGELAMTLLGPPVPRPAERTGAVGAFAGALAGPR